jgi:hypothetical protein
MTSYQVMGVQPETTAEAEVTRCDGTVCIRVIAPGEPPPWGGYGRVVLAEPVSIEAGEQVEVDVPYAAFGWSSAPAQPFTAGSAVAVTSLFPPFSGWPAPGRGIVNGPLSAFLDTEGRHPQDG